MPFSVWLYKRRNYWDWNSGYKRKEPHDDNYTLGVPKIIEDQVIKIYFYFVFYWKFNLNWFRLSWRHTHVNLNKSSKKRKT